MRLQVGQELASEPRPNQFGESITVSLGPTHMPFLQSLRDLAVDQASLAESNVPGGLLTAVNEWLHYSY